jgi:anti-sigma B factor antagonist
MSAMPNEFSVRTASQVAIIDLQGRLDAFAGDTLDKAYAQVNRQETQALLLNFEGVDYISSAGIALIIGLIIQTTKAGRRLLACGLSNHYIQVFQTARLTDYISIFPNQVAALSSVQDVGFQI